MRLRRYEPSDRTGCRTPIDSTKCAAQVWHQWHGTQCEKRRSPDSKDGEWCLTHCPDRRAAKEAKKADARNAAREERLAKEIAEARAPYERVLAAFMAWRNGEDRYDFADVLRRFADEETAKCEEGAWWRD